MSRVIAVDPGLSGTGWCLGVDGVLTEAGTITIPAAKSKALSLYARCRYISDKLPEADYCVIERMWVSKAKSMHANNLLKTAFLSGMIGGRYPEGETVYPSVWMPYKQTSSCNKEWIQGQVQEKLGWRKLGELIGHIGKTRQNHAVDAIGMLMWYYKREAEK